MRSGNTECVVEITPVHHEYFVEFFEVFGAELTTEVIDEHAVPFGIANGAVVGTVADMVIGCPARFGVVEVCEAFGFYFMVEDGFGQGRAAYVTEADEKDFFHGKRAKIAGIPDGLQKFLTEYKCSHSTLFYPPFG